MVSLKQSDVKEVYIGLCCKPTLEIEKINQTIGYPMMTFYSKKFVFPES